MGTSLAWLAAALGLGWIGAIGYAFWRVVRRPTDDVLVGAREPRRPGERRIVCAGDSITHATVSFDYVRALRERLGPSTRIFNAGVNGDLAYNLAERLPSIVACAPDIVVVLIGTNDLCGAQTESVARQQRRTKQLPEFASLEFFEEQLRRVLRGLRAETSARIVVVTPPLLGEDLTHPVYTRLCAFAERAIELANAHDAQVIAFHSAMADALRASGHAARPGFSAGVKELSWLVTTPLQHYLTGMSYDRISRRRGLWGSADLIHLNETSGAILVQLLENALRAGALTEGF
jgi:lysophospholipase L1-like esterase